jgi:hypothetical protein
MIDESRRIDVVEGALDQFRRAAAYLAVELFWRSCESSADVVDETH